MKSSRHYIPDMTWFEVPVPSSYVDQTTYLSPVEKLPYSRHTISRGLTGIIGETTLKVETLFTASTPIPVCEMLDTCK